MNPWVFELKPSPQNVVTPVSDNWAPFSAHARTPLAAGGVITVQQEEIPDCQHWVPAWERGEESQKPLHDEMHWGHTQFLLDQYERGGEREREVKKERKDLVTLESVRLNIIFTMIICITIDSVYYMVNVFFWVVIRFSKVLQVLIFFFLSCTAQLATWLVKEPAVTQGICERSNIFNFEAFSNLLMNQFCPPCHRFQQEYMCWRLTK